MAAKKTFADDLQSRELKAVSMFVGGTPAQEETPAAPAASLPEKVPDGYYLKYVEKKSRRIQLLLQPSIADAGKIYAQEHGISFNELVSQALQAYLKESNDNG